jgi:rRNA-processing protein FCF1
MSLDYLLPLVHKYRSKGLLIDTNLLLLLFIGSAIPEILPTFKPITNQGFSEKDYNLLRHFASRFTKIITTPHVLTEVSNHCDKLKGKYRATYCESLIPLIKALKEETVEAATLCEREHFIDFGLADMAISEISSSAYLVLTIDFDLVGHLKKRKIDVINFNHMRLIANE